MNRLRRVWNNTKKITRYIYESIKTLFTKRYFVTVSFNSVYGDSDDRTFIAKKIIVQKEKHLKFRDEENKVVEYRSSGGLNFIIEDYEYKYGTRKTK
jgi:hypothetical protein